MSSRHVATYHLQRCSLCKILSGWLYNEPLREVLCPYRALADLIEQSGLDYTILRPDWFTDADEINYQLTPKGQPETGGAVSRKSIADFVCMLFAEPAQHIGDNLNISKP